MVRFRASLSLTLLLLLGATAAINAQTLRIYHIDVEQGAATLFISPSGHTMLVDSGKNGHGSRIKAIMDQASVTQINYYICTHYHEDHYGGIDDLVRDYNVPVLETYDRGDKAFLPSSRTESATYRDYMATVGEDAIHLTRGRTIPLDDLMNVTCISSGGVVSGEQNPTPGVDENDMSLSLLVTLGQFRYFIGGDIQQTTEKKIAERDLVLNVNVYEADHHGSNTSSTVPFLEDMSPEVIIISNGNNQTYKHPRQETLTRYASLSSHPVVFQTNKYLYGGAGGNVEDAHIADPETVDDDGNILIIVNGATHTYTVSYGANSSYTYQIKGIAGGTVVIKSLLPNPVGPDDQLEEVTIRNTTGEAMPLSGWTLRDRSGLTWDLTAEGSLQPGESKVIVRRGRGMSLNNSGDEITLLDQSQTAHDRFAYATSSEGVRITTGH
jgi:beta-lactamase superfamily II metal-dependent hydrolase